MFTEVEIKGCESILKKLPQDDILSLKETVTNHQIAVESVTEAIEVIITYSETPQSLLKRKKIIRDSLFQYVHECKIPVSGNIDKPHLVNKILQYWKSNTSQESLNVQDTDSNSAGGDNCQTHATQTVPSEKGHHQELRNLPLRKQSNDSHNTNGNASQITDTQTNILQTQRHLHQVDQQAEKSVKTSDGTSNHDQLLAETFVTWFYKMLNSQNPSMNQTPEDFGPKHFWNDVKFCLVSITAERSKEEFHGCDLVCQRLLALVKEEFLLFNPNVSADGVKLQKDPHGIFFISVCGTVHRNNDCLGTFQQVFGIIRDPRFDNNWKIKRTQLGIRCSQVTSMPKLENNNDMLAIGLLIDDL